MFLACLVAQHVEAADDQAVVWQAGFFEKSLSHQAQVVTERTVEADEQRAFSGQGDLARGGQREHGLA